MDKDEIKEMRDYAWKYFSLHADQRIKTFNFYLVLATFAVGGMLTVIKDTGHAWVVAVIAFLLGFLSFVFYKLDCRNKQLVRHGEAALKRLEEESGFEDEESKPHVFKLFTKEKHDTDILKSKAQGEYPEFHLTYSNCFNAVFWMFGMGSLIVFILSLYIQFKK
jgi:hypothetical protein